MSNNTRSYLISEAKNLMRVKGYSAFSFADLAKKLGISKANVHYYFATKEVLAKEVILDAIEEIKRVLDVYYKRHSTVNLRLQAYNAQFVHYANSMRLTFSVALSAELSNIPPSLQSLVQTCFNVQIEWLAQVIQDGQQNQEIPAHLDSQQYALRIFMLFEGSSIIARVLNSPHSIEDALAQSLEILHCATS